MWICWISKICYCATFLFRVQTKNSFWKVLPVALSSDAWKTMGVSCQETLQTRDTGVGVWNMLLWLLVWKNQRTFPIFMASVFTSRPPCVPSISLTDALETLSSLFLSGHQEKQHWFLHESTQGKDKAGFPATACLGPQRLAEQHAVGLKLKRTPISGEAGNVSKMCNGGT